MDRGHDVGLGEVQQVGVALDVPRVVGDVPLERRPILEAELAGDQKLSFGEFRSGAFETCDGRRVAAGAKARIRRLSTELAVDADEILAALRARQRLVSELPISGELLRGSLLERTVRHTKDCPKCARGEGHRVFVLTVTYPSGRTRQFGVRRERVAEVRRWLNNYQELKEAIEAICELNHDLLRPERAVSKTRSKA